MRWSSTAVARADGSIADINAVWFSHWYLDNLNALYSGPLDHALWRSLNDKSLIASRLYEFLFFKFYGGQEFLRFNYPTLVKFIPVRTERYLCPCQEAVAAGVRLAHRRRHPRAARSGSRARAGCRRFCSIAARFLHPSARRDADAVEIGEEDFTLDRIEDIQEPEWQIVSAFHHAWGNDSFTPSKAELTLARELLAKHGQPAMQELMPRLVKRLKLKWADAKSFCAISRYFPEVLNEWQREKRRREREQHDLRAHDESRQQNIQKAQDQAVLKALWQTLSPAEQEDIRKSALKGQPAPLQKRPVLVERFCLTELAKRKGLTQH